VKVDCPSLVSALTEIGLGQDSIDLVSSACATTSPYIVIGGIVLAVLVPFGTVWRYWRSMWDRMVVFGPRIKLAFAALQGRSPDNGPRLSIVVDPSQSWWHMGKQDNADAMQIVLRGHVTNNDEDRGVIFLHATLPVHNEKHGLVSVRDSKSGYHGKYVVNPREVTEFSAHFFLSPPVKKVGEDFRTDIVIVDNFDRRHPIKRVLFPYGL
jgi:hypothetical protein